MAAASCTEVALSELYQLPLRPIVAYAVRCARRLQPRFQLPETTADRQHQLQVVEIAIQAAADFASARGDCSQLRAVVQAAYDVAQATSNRTHFAAYAAAHAAKAACQAVDEALREYDDVRMDVMLSAYGAGRVLLSNVELQVLDPVLAALRADYEHLLRLNENESTALGQQVDAGVDGPLGPLWPFGTPWWCGGTLR